MSFPAGSSEGIEKDELILPPREQTGRRKAEKGCSSEGGRSDVGKVETELQRRDGRKREEGMTAG